MEPTTRPRSEVLKEVNAILESEGLPLWTELKRIGNRGSREFQITGVSHVIRDLQQYYVIIVFNVIRPNGTTGQYGVRATRRIPACVIALINDQVLFVQQHRLATGRWMTELPRGWIDANVAQAGKGGVAQALLEREVGAEWMQSLERFDPVLIGSVWEDTGTRMDQVQIHLVRIASRTEFPRRQDHVNSKLYPWTQIHEMVDAGVINDQTTLTALYKAERFLNTRSAKGRDHQ